MDVHLKVLAEASLAVERAETAAGEGAFTAAREALDEAGRGLQELRDCRAPRGWWSGGRQHRSGSDLMAPRSGCRG
jgi:hypothetical protein